MALISSIETTYDYQETVSYSTETVIYDTAGNGIAVIDQDTKLRDIKLYGWEE